MKFIKLLILLFSYSVFASGWSSSGGGLLITNENNPWFMGEDVVNWCIDHGGSRQFSLNLNESKVEIEKGILALVTQLKISNSNSTIIRDPIAFWNDKSIFYRTCGIKKVNENGKDYFSKACGFTSDRILPSVNFQFVENCQNADLEIILGNQNNPKVQELINKIGLDAFQKIVGVTVRTEYSEKAMRAKGFIYIASDIGKNQYKGTRSLFFRNLKIWNGHKKINEKTKLPENLSANFDIKNIKINLKNEVVSPLLPVFTHEFGHILGFQHNHFNNLMDEDYPAEVVKNGVEFNGAFKRKSKIISAGLNEGRIEKTIGFEWNHKSEFGISPNELKQESPVIYDFIYSGASFNEEGVESKDILFLYSGSLFNTQTNGFTKLKIAEVDLVNKRYNVIRSFLADVDLSRGCDRPNVIDSVNFRHSQTPTKNLETIPLISLGTITKCGVLSVPGGKTIIFKLTHNYFQDNSVLELVDPIKPLINIKLILKQSDIILNSRGEQLPEPSLNLKF